MIKKNPDLNSNILAKFGFSRLTEVNENGHPIFSYTGRFEELNTTNDDHSDSPETKNSDVPSIPSNASSASSAQNQDNLKPKKRGRKKKVIVPQRICDQIWNVESWKFSQCEKTFTTEEIVLSINLDLLCKKISEKVKTIFADKVFVETLISKDGGDGGFWCFFQFLHPDSKKEQSTFDAAPSIHPLGLAGFYINVAPSKTKLLSVQFSNHFGIGLLPKNCFQLIRNQLHDIIIPTIENASESSPSDHLLHKGSEKNVGAPSIFEMSCNMIELATTSIIISAQNGTSDIKKSNIQNFYKITSKSDLPTPANISFEKNKIFVISNNGTEISNYTAAELSAIPLDVLESRELRTRFSRLEEQILENKLEDALITCLLELSHEPNSLYLLRRLAYIAVSGFSLENSSAFVKKALELEPKYKLFLSWGITISLDATSNKLVHGLDVLTLLSSLGKELSSHFNHALNISSFDVVLPELLGDAWSANHFNDVQSPNSADSLNMAKNCYHRIIQRRGPLPRILHKLIDIASRQNDSISEKSLLNELLKVERRKRELTKIYHRLAELIASTDPSSAIPIATKVLIFDPYYIPGALLLSELYIKTEKPEKAIHILDELLLHNRSSITTSNEFSTLSPSDATEIEYRIGYIWLHHLNRLDIAEKRLCHAIETGSFHLDSYKELCTIFRKNKNFLLLSKHLEQIIDYLQSQNNIKEIKPVFDELLSLYALTLKDKEKAFKLTTKFLKLVSLTPKDLDLLLSWDDGSFDWQTFYNNISSNILQYPSGSERGELYLKLALISKHKLSDRHQSIINILSAMKEIEISDDIFTRLLEDLASEKQYSQMAELIEIRLQKVPSEKRCDLADELFSLPISISEIKKDHLAIELYALDEQHEEILNHRFQYYRDLDDVDSVGNLLNLILNQNVSSERKTHWIRHCNKLLLTCVDTNRFSILENNYKSLFQLTSEKDCSILNEAIEVLQKASNPSFLKYFAATLLSLGEKPLLEPSLILELFHNDDLSLARFYELSVSSADNPLSAISYARKAKEHFIRLNDFKGAERLLEKICSFASHTEDEFHEFCSYVEKSGNYDTLVQSIQNKLELASDNAQKSTLYKKLAFVYRNFIKNYEQAKASYKTAAKLEFDQLHYLYHLSVMAKEFDNLEDERKYLTQFLESDLFEDSPTNENLNENLVLTAFERLIELEPDRQLVESSLESVIESAMAQTNFQLAGKLCDLAHTHEIANLSLYSLSFKTHELLGNHSRGKKMWLKGLSISNAESYNEYINATKEFFELKSKRSVFCEYLQTSLEQASHLKLPPKTVHDIHVLYASFLFEEDSTKQKSFNFFKKAFESDIHDSRTWAPLFSLLNSCAEQEERLLLEAKLVPLLRQKPELLIPYNLSLPVDLQEKPMSIAMSNETEEVPNFIPLAKVAGDSSIDAPLPLDLFSTPPAKESIDALMSENAEPPSDLDATPIFKLAFPAEEISPENDTPASEELPTEGEKHVEQPISEDTPIERVFSLETFKLSETEPEPQAPEETPCSLSLADSSPDDGDTPSKEEFSSQADEHTQKTFVLDSNPKADPTPVVDDKKDEESNIPFDLAPYVTKLDGDSPLSHESLEADQLPQEKQMAPQALSTSFSSDLDLLPKLDMGHIEPLSEVKTYIEEVKRNSISGTHSSLEQDNTIDWRDAVTKGLVDRETSLKIHKQAFASELEKHIAIQMVSLMAGNVADLSDWHWHVWRHANEFNYPLSGKERFPINSKPKLLDAPLHKCILTASPIFIVLFRERFSLKSVADKIQTSVQSIEKTKRLVPWDSGILGEIGFKHYIQKFEKNRFQAFNIQRLGKDIFLDGKSRSIYFDEEYYKEVPTTHLFYKIHKLFWAYKLRYFIPLNLDPEKDVFPILLEMKSILNAQGLQKIKQTLGISQSHLAKIIGEFNESEQLKQMFEKIGPLTLPTLKQLWQQMDDYIYSLILSETLDIVGLVESITEKDLISQGNELSPGEILQFSPHIKILFDFATKLKV